MTTEERLEKLECELAHAKRGNRSLLAVMAVAVVGVALAWTTTRATPVAFGQGTEGVSKVIRANEFVLVDDQGKPRAVLTVTEDGPMLILSDEKGETRAMLGATKGGPSLSLSDEKGEFIWSAP